VDYIDGKSTVSPATFRGTCPVRPISLVRGVLQDIDKWIDIFKASALGGAASCGDHAS
jgi:hypothetical protein